MACAFSEAYRRLRPRISLLVGLPLAQLDTVSLKKKRGEIGQTDETDRPA